MTLVLHLNSFFFCVYIYDNRLGLLWPWDSDTAVYTYVHDCVKLLIPPFQCISNILPVYSPLLVITGLVILSVCMDGFRFYCIFAINGELSYFILLPVSHCGLFFQRREVPLKIELVGGPLHMFVKGTYNVIKEGFSRSATFSALQTSTLLILRMSTLNRPANHRVSWEMYL